MTRTLNMRHALAAPTDRAAAPAAAIEPPVIKRAAGNGAGELSARAAASSARTSSIEASPPEAMTGICHRLGERNGGIEIEALEHAVAGDVGVDDGRDARILEPSRDIEAR